MAGGGGVVASMWGGAQTKGLVKPKTQSAPILLDAFFNPFVSCRRTAARGGHRDAGRRWRMRALPLAQLALSIGRRSCGAATWSAAPCPRVSGAG